MINTLAELRARNEELEEEVRQLREMLSPKMIFPREFGTRQQQDILAVLLKNSPNVVTGDRLSITVRCSRTGESLDDVTLKIQICKLRPKLARFNITIKTYWGVGYFLPEESARKVRSLCVQGLAA